MPQNAERWHMSKNISVINLIGLVVSTISIIVTVTWGASVLNSEIQQNKKDIAKNAFTVDKFKEDNFKSEEKIQQNITRIEQQASAQAVAIGRIEVGVDNVQKTLEDLGRKLDGR